MRRSLVLVGFGAIVAMLVAMLPAESTARSAGPVVMTRNLYLGADLTSIIGASDLTELSGAAADTWLSVVATDFPERAKLIA